PLAQTLSREWSAHRSGCHTNLSEADLLPDSFETGDIVNKDNLIGYYDNRIRWVDDYMVASSAESIQSILIPSSSESSHCIRQTRPDSFIDHDGHSEATPAHTDLADLKDTSHRMLAQLTGNPLTPVQEVCPDN